MSTKDRILDVALVGFLYGHGGDAIQMLELASGLQDRGVRVKVFVPDVPESVTFKSRADLLGVACERTSLISPCPAGPKQRPLRLARLLRSIDAPLIHFHTGDSALPRTLMPLLALMPRRLFAVTVQSPYELLEPGSSKARYWATMAKRTIDAVISPSQHGCDYQANMGVPRSKLSTVRNSIDVEAMRSGKGSAAREIVGAGPKDRIVLFCSRLDVQKRPLEALRIFAAVAGEYPDALLVFVGDGALEGEVRAEAERLRIADRVRLLGYRTDVPNWLAAATVWLLPTERENFSLAVLEAMAAGCAIVSTLSPGNDEVLINGENALTFGVDDVEDGSSAVRALLGDADLRTRIGQTAQRQAQEYSAARMVDAYWSVYETIGWALRP